MLASSWQTLSNVFTVIRDISNKDSTTLPDTVLIPLANKYYFQIVRELVDLREELYCEISYTDLVASQREYMIPTDDTDSPYGGGAIKLHRVEVSYDGTNWEVAKHIPLTMITTPTVLDSDIDIAFDKGSPRYYFKDRSLFLLPPPDSTDDVAASNGNLYIYWVKRPDELTSSTNIPDLPKDFLGILQEGILYDVFRKLGKVVESRDALQNYHVAIEKMKSLEQNIDTEQKTRLHNIFKDYS